MQKPSIFINVRFSFSSEIRIIASALSPRRATLNSNYNSPFLSLSLLHAQVCIMRRHYPTAGAKKSLNNMHAPGEL